MSAALGVCTVLCCGVTVALIAVAATSAGKEHTVKGICIIGTPTLFTTTVETSDSSSVGSFDASDVVHVVPYTPAPEEATSSSLSSSSSSSSTPAVSFCGCAASSDYGCWLAGGTFFHEHESKCPDHADEFTCGAPAKRHETKHKTLAHKPTAVRRAVPRRHV